MKNDKETPGNEDTQDTKKTGETIDESGSVAESCENTASLSGHNSVETGWKPKISDSLGFKFITIGVISLLLLIPALLIWGLVEERAARADRVATEIASGWGKPQLINGPYLVVPYLVTEKTGDQYRDQRYFAIQSPKSLTVENDVDVTERQKSIYKTPLYRANIQLSAEFDPFDRAQIVKRNGRAQLNDAFIAINVSDTAGFRSNVTGQINDGDVGFFNPGLNGLENENKQISHSGVQSPQRWMEEIAPHETTQNGIYLSLDREQISNDLTFKSELAINGSRHFAMVPSGQSTEISVSSNWPHPGFSGRFLPQTHSITNDGFDALWNVPNLARGISALSHGKALEIPKSTVHISFVKPVDFYQLVSRSLKYAIAFLALIFLAMFILEITSGNNIHWIQYILTGLSIIVFYILLLALAEQVGFQLAYMIASMATTILIVWYVAGALNSVKMSYILGTAIGLIYGIIYLTLNEDEFALLIGAMIAFIAIATTMMATRNINWDRLNLAPS